MCFEGTYRLCSNQADTIIEVTVGSTRIQSKISTQHKFRAIGHLSKPVLRIQIRIRIHRIHVFLGLLDPDPLVRGMDPDPDPAPDPDPSVIMQK